MPPLPPVWRWISGLLALVLLAAAWPALAWDEGDPLRICNKNRDHDVSVAYAVQAVPHGIAALLASGWQRAGWWRIPAGRCQHTMELRDVQNYEIWLYVRVVGGDQIFWKGRDARFCLHPDDAFEQFAWKREELQTCAAGERLETFSYMGSLYNADDAYSIYSVANRTIDLDFTYAAAASPSPARQPTPPASTPTAAPAAVARTPTPPALRKFVQICTPQVVDRNGDFTPAAAAAIASGGMDRHFLRMDASVDAMKADPGSVLRRLLQGAAPQVRLVLPAFDQPDQGIAVVPLQVAWNLPCAAGFRTARYQAAHWLGRPGLSPADLDPE